MPQTELARTLDQIVIQLAALRQQPTVSNDQLNPFLNLVQSALNDLQAENSRLFNQLASTKHGLITVLELANV